MTLTHIAEVVGLHVSSVHKILNEKPGPVFSESTIKAVRAAAKRLGWRKLCCACKRPITRAESFRFHNGKELCRACVLAVVGHDRRQRTRDIDRQLAQISQSSQVDDELAKMKSELGAGEQPKELAGGEDEKT